MAISPMQTLQSAIAAAVDPVAQRNLRAVAEHVEAEVAGDVDRLMATMVAEPLYRIWGASKSAGPKGNAEVRAHYERLVRSGKNRLTYDISRVVADQRCVVTEGRFRLAYPGLVVAQLNLPDGQPIRSDHWYLVEYQCLVVWPMDDESKIQGEELYVGEPPKLICHLDDGEHNDLGPNGRANGIVTEGWV